MQELITPSGAGGSEESRKAISGWKAIQQGKKPETRQERLIRESQEKRTQPQKLTENNYRPGDEEASGEFNMRKLRESANRMVQKQVAQREFKGSPEQCISKLDVLFNGIEDPMTGSKKGPAKKPEIIKIEESGFGTYKITYIA